MRAGGQLVLSFGDGRYGQLCPIDRKRHVEPGVGQVVDTIGLVLATSAARILAKNLDQAGQLCGRDLVLQCLCKLDVELLPRVVLDPAARCVRMTVRKRNVGLDVVDRRAVAKVGAQHMDDGTVVGELNAIELYTGKADGIGAKRATCGKHAHALGTSQARRTHGL